MADENDDVLNENATAGPRAPERAFVPLTDYDPMPRRPGAPGTGAQVKKPAHRRRHEGVPLARIDRDLVEEFEEEIEIKVSTGKRRMRWFANHLILFVACAVAAVPLRYTIWAEVEGAFFYIPFGIWAALLAFHANYAMNPMLRRSERETQIKAVVPPSDDNDDDDGRF